MSRFSGHYGLEWKAPGLYRYRPYPAEPFAYRTDVVPGLVVVPEEMDTDGASTPRVLWTVPGYSPWDWLPAALVHDWAYEAKALGRPYCSRLEADLMLREGVLDLGFSKVVAETVYRAVRVAGGPWWRT